MDLRHLRYFVTVAETELTLPEGEYELITNSDDGVRVFVDKTAVIDDDWSMVGTANLDYRSFNLNLEINLVSRCVALTELLAPAVPAFAGSARLPKGCFPTVRGLQRRPG